MTERTITSALMYEMIGRLYAQLFITNEDKQSLIQELEMARKSVEIPDAFKKVGNNVSGSEG